MIQRIQTLYLVIADILVALLLFLPVAAVSGKDGKLYNVSLYGILPEGIEAGAAIQKTWPLLIFACLVMALLVVIILQYGNRKRQIRLSYVAILLLLGLTALIYYYIGAGQTSLGGVSSIKIFFSFPLIAAVLVFLAIQGITKDEQLVKSIDRIR